MAASAPSAGPVSVLMVGTGEYTTGFGASSAKTDKAAGVVALAMLDLRRRGLVGALSMAGTSSGKFPAMRAHMRRAIDETERRRAKQTAFNEANGIVPRGVSKRIKDLIDGVYDAEQGRREVQAARNDALASTLSEKDLAREIKRVEKEMLEHARNLEFEQAAAKRDELRRLKERLFGPGEGAPEALPPAAGGRRAAGA